MDTAGDPPRKYRAIILHRCLAEPWYLITKWKRDNSSVARSNLQKSLAPCFEHDRHVQKSGEGFASCTSRTSHYEPRAAMALGPPTKRGQSEWKV
jgi:hypothetical protein